MKMPFGKHKDVDLKNVPRHYLQWLRGQEWIDDRLAKAIDRTLNGEATEDVNELIPRRRSEQPTGEYSIEAGFGAWSVFDPSGEEIAWTMQETVAQVVCKILNDNKELLSRENEKDD